MGDTRLNLGCGKFACVREGRFARDRSDDDSMASRIDRRRPFRL